MKLILPSNRNVTPVILPCVEQHIQDLNDVDFQSTVSESELAEGEAIVRKWYSPWVDLSDFKYAYYMGDGITKAIDLTRLEYADKAWSVVAGDYEWPLAYGKLNRRKSVDNLTDEVNYITQPFAGTGDIWDHAVLERITGKLVLDMAYVSTVNPTKLPIPPATDRIFLGASKTFGTPYLRHGWLFSKTAIPQLDLFFKSIKYFSSFGFRAGIHLYSKVSPTEQYYQGREFQDEIRRSNTNYDLAGDSWLINNTLVPLGEHLKRANVYRVPLGLTIQKMILERSRSHNVMNVF